MSTLQCALLAASKLRGAFVGDSGYGLAYGSHVAHTASPRSDLDLVFIAPGRPAADTLDQLADAVQRLHHDHGLDLDTEVDYAAKVHASFADVDAAVSLRCFDIDAQGGVIASPVVVEPWFRNSPTFTQRLLLNALTSPHAFLGGAIDAYEHHRQQAEQALALLALSLLDSATTLTLNDAVTVLTHGPAGTTGKDYLGYVFNPELYSTLHRGRQGGFNQ